MRHIVDYCDSGHGVLGPRTATHAFSYGKDAGALGRYSWNSREPGYEGGWGRLVLGETWVGHWGKHGGQSTRGVFAPGAAQNPILRGIADGEIWVCTDTYQVRLPLLEGSTPLIMGQVLGGMTPADAPVGPEVEAGGKRSVNKNDPMIPVAWTRTYTGPSGKPARVFTTTMGGSMATKPDWDNEALRRLLVKATYWATGLDAQIPARADVALVEGEVVKRGVRP